MTHDPVQPLDAIQDPTINLSPQEPDLEEEQFITTLAAAAGGGMAGAAIGQLVAGRVGAAVGAVVGGVAGMALQQNREEVQEQLKAVGSSVTERIEDGIHRSQEVAQQAIDAGSAQLQGVMESVTSEQTAEESVSTTPSPADRLSATASPVAPYNSSSSYSAGLELPAETHYKLGVSLAQQGQIEDAIVEFQSALEQAPDSAETHYNLGVACSKVGELSQGVEWLEQAKALCLAQNNTPGAAFVEQALGRMTTRLKRKNEAFGQPSGS